MGEGGPLINLGDITKPATVLIEKISDAIGGMFRPYQIKRVAGAEAQADKIRALADIEISEIQRRAIVRMIEEEGKKQENIEAITAKAIDDLRSDAKPEDLDKDWLAHFFDRCKLISDTEMQSLWGRLLAGEANRPSSFSKRTIEAVATFDKKDAELFTKFCGFVWGFPHSQPLVFDTNAIIYNERRISFATVAHLENIGLVSFDNSGYQVLHYPEEITSYYFGKPIRIKFPGADNPIKVGNVMFTQVGAELFPIAGAAPIDGFESYVASRLTSQGLTVYSPWPRQGDNRETTTSP